MRCKLQQKEEELAQAQKSLSNFMTTQQKMQQMHWESQSRDQKIQQLKSNLTAYSKTTKIVPMVQLFYVSCQERIKNVASHLKQKLRFITDSQQLSAQVGTSIEETLSISPKVKYSQLLVWKLYSATYEMLQENLNSQLNIGNRKSK